MSGFALPPPTPADPGRPTILVVDDEDAVREFVRIVLSEAGYAVSTACDGVEALALFQADPDRFDLVVSDVRMPNLTGIELAIELRQVRPGALILLISAFTGDTPADIPPDVPLLNKPFSRDRLLEVVAEVLWG